MKKYHQIFPAALLSLAFLYGCSESNEPPAQAEAPPEAAEPQEPESAGTSLLPGRRFAGELDMIDEYFTRSPERNASRNAYFGDRPRHVYWCDGAGG